MGGRIAVLVLALVAAMPSSAWALAGGATGSGGGGGGGGFSGGGGSYSGGSGGHGRITWGGVLIGFGAAALFVLLSWLWQRRKAKSTGAGGGGFQGTPGRRRKAMKRSQQAEGVARAANAGDDGYWDPDDLEKRVREAFYPIQLSWAKRDVSMSRPYVSEELYKRHELQLEGLEKQNRVNRIQDLQLDRIAIVRVVNVTDDSKDRFVAFVECRARDWMEDAKTGKVVNGNPHAQTTFQQYWSFTRDPHRGWVLDEIQQGEEGDYHMDAKDIDTDDGAVQPAAGA